MQSKIRNLHYSSRERGPRPSTAAVLVIDDDPDILDSLSLMLASAGYSAASCRSGAEALDLVRRQKPNLVISDINLTGASGLELCTRFRRDEGMSMVPWMFLSGAQLPDIIRRAHEAGASYYVRKPFDPELLLELVEQLLPG
ncbi:MAG TPA: response regulator [Pirellulales bacterium]|jgi:CheY-like chemotaxis protein